MLVIGLTGGIGSGKSTVGKILADLGAAVVNGDELSREVLSPHTEAWNDVVVAFGKGILLPDGSIDRKKLAEVVFTDSSSLANLNSIMLPRMFEVFKRRLEQWRRQGVKVVVLEAAVLIESGWVSVVDQIWVVRASRKGVEERMRRKGVFSEAQVQARMRSQLTAEELVKHADVVIENDGSINELRTRVGVLWAGLKLKDTK